MERGSMEVNFNWIYMSQFDVWSNNPAYWHDKATTLMHASEILWKSYESGELLDGGNTHRFLMGLSFELIFKAFYVAEKQDPPTHHSLNDLTKHCNFKLNGKDRKTLEVLTRYIVWDGRYPTPKKPKKEPCYQGIKEQTDPFINTLSIEKQLGGESNQLLKRSDLDFEHLIDLWRKINDAYVGKYI